MMPAFSLSRRDLLRRLGVGSAVLPFSATCQAWPPRSPPRRSG